MVLTTNGKDYIAKNFGVNDCFVESGLTWVDVGYDTVDASGNVVKGERVDSSGGTKNIVGRIITTMVYEKVELTSPRTGTFTNAQLVSANDDQIVTLPDAKTIGQEDGGVGETQYCVDAVTPAPTPTERKETPPLQVYVGGGESCPKGSPGVELDTSEAFAYFKADPITYVGVMDILVRNLSDKCFSYFAWEMRMWDGPAGDSCPLTAPERQEISRFLAEVSDTKVISVTRANASEVKMIGASFEIPAHLEGLKTICLSLWGNYSKQALLDELLVDGRYAEEIPW